MDILKYHQNIAWKLSNHRLPPKNILLLFPKHFFPKEINCVNKTKTEDVVKITDRAALHIASKFGYLQELVRILRDKEKLKFKCLQRDNDRLLKSMDNCSNATDVSSEDDAATVEQILNLMKPHIEEKIGVELEAANISTDAIRDVMRSTDQLPQYHTIPLQYAIQLEYQVSKGEYYKIR